MSRYWALLSLLVLLPPILLGLAAVIQAVFEGVAGLFRQTGTESSMEPHRRASRFVPGMLAGIACSLLVAGTVGYYWSTSFSGSGVVPVRPIAPVRTVRAQRASNPVLAEQDVEQLLTRLRNQDSDRPSPIPVIIPPESEENLPPAEPELQATDDAESVPGDAASLPVTVFVKADTDGERVAELPEWTAQEVSANGFPRVVKTGPHATVADAEAEALTLLSAQLAEVFAKDHPQAAGWTPPVEVVREAGTVQRRAVEQRAVPIGDFTEPVFRAYWEVVPPDDLDARLFAAWRSEELGSRLLLVGGGIGLLTLCFGSLAGYFRINHATRGKYSRPLRWGTAALWIAAGSALAIMA